LRHPANFGKFQEAWRAARALQSSPKGYGAAIFAQLAKLAKRSDFCAGSEFARSQTISHPFFIGITIGAHTQPDRWPGPLGKNLAAPLRAPTCGGKLQIGSKPLLKAYRDAIRCFH
jgi:hypothetical protein